LIMPMYLHTLGGLCLEGSAFSRPKPLLLLAYLALEGSQPRSRLAELFFMETSDGKNSLSRALTYLRKEVPGVIEADNKKVWTTVSCDAAELLNLTDSKQFEKCLKLYQGAFAVAVDYALELSGELEEWFYATREILAAKARNAFLALGEQEASKGNFSQAAHLAEKAYRLKEAAELEPDDFGRLYNLLYAGNSPLATEVKKEAEGFEIPLELSREEAKAHLSETSETKLETANNLPLPKSSFVGRDQELVAVATQLAKVDCRLLTLHGTGGVGKSRLALQAAYDQLKGGSWEGVYFVALDALNSHELIGSSIAEALGLELQGQDDTLSQVQRFIGKKHLLFVLDNYEHLIAGATLTSKLLASCPNLKILVTSRERLNVEEEWVLTLEGLTVPEATPDTLNEAEHFEAVDMFLQRAKRARLDFAISEGDLPHVLKICRLVDGLPLGIELAAVWVKTLPLSEIAREIESNLNILETPSKNVAERHQSIRAAFEHSWRLLTDKEQEVLRKLSVFVGGFRREAASEVAGATLPILASLVDKSLLRVSENGRYDRHFLIYEFTYNKLAQNNSEFVTVQKIHGDFYFNFILQKERGLFTSEQGKTLRELEEELENVYKAWNYFFEQLDLTRILSVVNTIADFFSTKGRAKEGIELFTQTYNKIENEIEKRTIVLAGLLKGSALLFWELGRFGEAQRLAEESLSLFEGSEFLRETAWLLRYIGVIASKKGDYSKAKVYLERELTITKSIEDKIGVASALSNLGLLYIKLGQYIDAEDYLQESTKIYSEVGSLSGIANNLDNLGTLYLCEHKLEEAEIAFRKGWSIAREIDDRFLMPYVLLGLANILFYRGNVSLAKSTLNQALEITSQTFSKATMPPILNALAKSEITLRLYDNAERYLYRAISTAIEIDARPELLKSLVIVAELYLKKGNRNQANALLEYIIRDSVAWRVTKEEAQTLLSMPQGTNEKLQAEVGILAFSNLENILQVLKIGAEYEKSLGI
jgi:predicted ATPase